MPYTAECVLSQLGVEKFTTVGLACVFPFFLRGSGRELDGENGCKVADAGGF